VGCSGTTIVGGGGGLAIAVPTTTPTPTPISVANVVELRGLATAELLIIVHNTKIEIIVFISLSSNIYLPKT